MWAAAREIPRQPAAPFRAESTTCTNCAAAQKMRVAVPARDIKIRRPHRRPRAALRLPRLCSFPPNRRHDYRCSDPTVLDNTGPQHSRRRSCRGGPQERPRRPRPCRSPEAGSLASDVVADWPDAAGTQTVKVFRTAPDKTAVGGAGSGRETRSSRHSRHRKRCRNRQHKRFQ
jgi:hypothetical protein